MSKETIEIIAVVVIIGLIVIGAIATLVSKKGGGVLLTPAIVFLSLFDDEHYEPEFLYPEFTNSKSGRKKLKKMKKNKQKAYQTETKKKSSKKKGFVSSSARYGFYLIPCGKDRLSKRGERLSKRGLGYE